MVNVDGSDIGRYLGLGAGAVAMPMLAAKATFLSTVLSHNILAYSMGGITVAGVLLAGLGIGIVDKLVFNK